MTNAIDVERQNEAERAAAAERNRRLREAAIHHGELGQLLPAGARAGVVRVVENFLRMDEAQRTALLAALER